MRELRAERRAQKIITQRQEELRVAAMTPNKKKKNGGNNAVNDPSIPPELSKHLLQMYNPDESKRIPNETAMAISEVLKTFVVEATSRASIEVSPSAKSRSTTDPHCM